MVAKQRMVVFGEQQADAGLYLPMLEYIVHHYHLRRFLLFHQSAYALHSFFAHCYLYIRVLGGYHGRFVTQQCGVVGTIVEQKSFAVALVASAEQGSPVVGRKQVEQVFRHGGLAAAASAEVAYTEGGDMRCFGFLETDGIEHIPHRHTDGVPQGQWKQ